MYTNDLCDQESVKKQFFNKKYTFTICVGRVWIVIGYFLFEKQAFNGLLKVISIQKNFLFEKEAFYGLLKFIGIQTSNNTYL